MNCHELDNYLHEFLDNELEPARRSEVANHLASCRHCAVRVAGFERADRQLRALGAVEAPPEFVLDVRRKIERQKAPEPVEPAAVGSFWEGLTRWLRLPLGVRLAFGAAVVVVAAAIVILLRPEPAPVTVQREFVPAPSGPVVAETPVPVEEEMIGEGIEDHRVASATGFPSPELAPLELEPVLRLELLRAESPSERPMTLATPPAPTGPTAATNVVPDLALAPPPLPREAVPPWPPPRTTRPGDRALASIPHRPAMTNLPTGLQSGWLDLATRIFYPRSETNLLTGGFVRGHFDERNKFVLTSTRVEGPVAELDSRQAARRGTQGWLELNTFRFIPARPGLRPSYPFIEGYQDEQGEFHPTSRRIYRAGN
jgi:hypothetical protein